jgi:hypothetical protein
MSEELHAGHFDQERQWISFNSGIDTVAPDPTTFPVHILTGDTFLYEIQGGFPDGNLDHFMSAPVVFPSSEYWETLLNGERKRPFFDLSISEYNTLRIPTAVHEYDVYADKGKFYEDVEIDGGLKVVIGGGSGDIEIDGNLTCNEVFANKVTAEELIGVAKTRVHIINITEDRTLADDDTGAIIHSSPATGNVDITLPSGLKTGFVVTITNLLPGKTTTLPVTLKARGNVLSEPYSAATIYYDGTDWYGFGDLV